MSRLNASLALLLGASFLTASASAAQTEIYSIVEGSATNGFGTDLVALDDIDGDGVADFAVSDLLESTTLPGGMTVTGSIHTYSGASGAPLWVATQDASDPGGVLGYGLALVDDLNGDGIRDLAVARLSRLLEANTSRLIFLSGLSGARLGATPPVTGVSDIKKPIGVADADGDGLRDVLVIAVPGGSQRVLSLYSSATGQKLNEWQAIAAGERFGDEIAEMGDLDGLGAPDYAAVVYDDSTGTLEVGIEVFSAETGARLPRVTGFAPPATQVLGIEPFVDMNGDGQVDLALHSSENVGGAFLSVLRVVSVVDGTTLRAVYYGGAAGDGALGVIGDYDRDGVLDLGFGMPLGGDWTGPLDPTDGGVAVYSGSTMLEIGRFRPGYDSLQLGSGIIPMGDLDGDGVDDYIASGGGTVNSSVTAPARVIAVALPRFVTYSYCNFAWPNSTGLTTRLESSGTTSVAANDLVVSARDLPQNVFGFLLVSESSNSIPLAGGGISLCIGGPIGRLTQPGQIRFSGSAGAFDIPVDLGQIPTPTGSVAARPFSTLYFQCWHRDSGTFNSSFSNGLGAALVP